MASIKAASGLTSGGRIPSGKIKDSLAELYYLSPVAPPVRRLVLTTRTFYDIFTKATAGAIAGGIEVACVPLPAAMQKRVDDVVRVASREVSPASAAQAVATEIESAVEG